MTSLMQRIRRRSPQRPVADEPSALPTGAEPQDPAAPAVTSFRERGRLRRRLRYLRRVRELGFRDVGGLVFDLHRFGRTNDELVATKIAALDAVDQELRALETALDDRREITELHEPGVGACPRCAALHGSEARFCPSCGLELRGPRALGETGPPAPATPPAASGLAPAPAAPADEPAPAPPTP